MDVYWTVGHRIGGYRIAKIEKAAFSSGFFAAPFAFPLFPGTSRPRPALENVKQGWGKTMELTEYPLLHEVDLILTLLKVATEGPASLDDAVGRLKRNLQSVGESLPVSDEEVHAHLSRIRDRLIQAVLLAPVDEGRFRITPRGMQALSDHPGGIDDSVLMNFPEFRAFVEAEAGRPVKRMEGGGKSGDDPRITEFDQGYAAFHEGVGLQSNPYERDRVMHLAWENGWCEARDDAMRAEGWADKSNNI
jgi:restriction system protein